jgi:3',5'-cyclic AMP phosphodiesterase CpdA
MQRRDLLKRFALASGASLTAAAAAAESLLAKEVATTTSKTRKRVLRFAHLTDIHIYSNRAAATGLATALQHVQSLDDRPEFILNGGDAIYDALEVDRQKLEQQWKLWNTVWKAENSLPVKHCLGNHDVWGWDKKSATKGDESGWGKGYSLDQLGLEKSYYDFRHAGWQFVVLDSVTKDPATVYRAELGEAQFEWLKGVLADTPNGTPIVIVSHIPILTVGDITWSRELSKQPIAHQMLVHQDRAELMQLFANHPNIKLCLSGHTHLTEQIQIAGLDFVNSGAVCGLWWKGNNAHTEEGYNLVDLFDDGSFETEYISYGWDAA